MKNQLRKAFESEMDTAITLYRTAQFDRAFKHLENAHILGQLHIVPHVRSHWWMLKIGLQRREIAEVWGQSVRIVLGALGSGFHVVPRGNSGGTDISMFARKPVEPRLAALLETENQQR